MKDQKQNDENNFFFVNLLAAIAHVRLMQGNGASRLHARSGTESEGARPLPGVVFGLGLGAVFFLPTFACAVSSRMESAASKIPKEPTVRTLKSRVRTMGIYITYTYRMAPRQVSSQKGRLLDIVHVGVWDQAAS
jgi:hypothetical protein